MKRRWGWLLALAAVLGLVGYGIVALRNSLSVSAKSSPGTTVPIHPSSSFYMKAIARAQQRMASDERMRHFKEENAKLRARVATTMSKISPELRRRTTDMLRQRRDPKYRALFEAWDLDATTGDEVLSVIRERDNRIQEALYRYLEADGNSRDYVDGKNREQREASARILDLVGDEHYAELAQFESETTEAERAENKEKICKFAKPPPPAIKL